MRPALTTALLGAGGTALALAALARPRRRAR